MKEKKQRTVLTLPLRVTEKWQEDFIIKKMELSRKIYNDCIRYLRDRLRIMEELKSYRDSMLIR